jgi:hypothetical protein
VAELLGNTIFPKPNMVTQVVLSEPVQSKDPDSQGVFPPVDSTQVGHLKGQDAIEFIVSMATCND